MTARLTVHILTLVLLAVLGAAILTPIYTVVRDGFEEDGRFTLAWFQDAWSFEPNRIGLFNSLRLALATTGLVLLIAVPLAMLAETFNFAGKPLWLALIQAPMILPPFVGAVGMKGLLSRNGGINSLLAHFGLIDPARPIDWMAEPFWTCVVLEALYLYPIAFLNIQAALANIDPALDEAGRNLGAGWWRRFWRITLPLMRPGIFAGATIVLIWSFTDIGTPLMVGLTDLTPVQVFRQVEKTNPDREAYALVIIMLAASILLYVIGKLVLGRPGAAMTAKATVAAKPARLGSLGSAAVTLPFALVFLVSFLPHIGVILTSLSATGMIELVPHKLTLKYHAQLVQDIVSLGGAEQGEAARSVVNSFKYAILATVVDVVLGFGVAYLVVRHRSWLTATLDNLAMLPLAVPGLVLAFGYFAMTQGDTWLSFLDPQKNDPTPLLVLAYAMRRLPLLVRACAAGLEQVSIGLEEAAWNLGAGRLRTLLTIVVPLLVANFIAGGLLVFSRSMLEVSDSLILAFDKSTYPIAKEIYNLAAIPQAGLEMASALGVWGMVLLISTIAIASLALGRRLGALFRV